MQSQSGLKIAYYSFQAPIVYLANKYWLFNVAVIIADKGDSSREKRGIEKGKVKSEKMLDARYWILDARANKGVFCLRGFEWGI